MGEYRRVYTNIPINKNRMKSKDKSGVGSLILVFAAAIFCVIFISYRQNDDNQSSYSDESGFGAAVSVFNESDLAKLTLMSEHEIEAAAKRYIEEHKEEYVYPLEGTLTSAFAYRTDPIDGTLDAYHAGIDIAPAEDHRIRAYSDGTVSFSAKTEGEYGNYIIISHGNGVDTLYAHCSELYVREGDKVRAGDVIGIAGSTGRSTGTHLHFEVRMDGVAVDPLTHIEENGAYGWEE